MKVPPEVMAIFKRFARLKPSGTEPMLCRPSKGETKDPDKRKNDPGNDWKVIYDDKGAAQSAAAALFFLNGKSFIAYPCARSTRGHYHLTTKPKPIKKPQIKRKKRGTNCWR